MYDWQQLKCDSRIFFVGIGGISMSGLAEIAQSDGYRIAGSDLNPSHRTAYLSQKGITIFSGHQFEWIDQFEPDLVVHTAAVHEDNPELIRAHERHIPVVDRAEFLGWINRSFSKVINIAGTHGKTTTTALCALILIEAGCDPTVHLGAELHQFDGTVRTGKNKQVMVSEACEYMNSFLQFTSTTAAILNIDYDHVDCFSNIDAVIDAFTAFADRLPEEGILVIPDFDPNIEKLIKKLKDRRKAKNQRCPRIVSFGFYPPVKNHAHQKAAHFTCRHLSYEQGMPRFEIWHGENRYCKVELRVPGRHNVANALAAVACAHENGADAHDAAVVLNRFEGAEGRFTDIGFYRNARVIADYAHHPTAARVTLEAAKLIPHQNLWVVFQPLTFSRTRVLFDDYVSALKDCDHLIFSEIYSNRESHPGNISSKMLAERINELGGHAEFAETLPEIQSWLDQHVQPGDLILVLGPENIRDFADQLTGRTQH